VNYSKFLTKSRFKLAPEYPTKLFYTGKPQRYQNLKQEESFLVMPADGGYSVCELAKCFNSHRFEISSPHNVEAEALTFDQKENFKLQL
jgi:hypothetical protein